MAVYYVVNMRRSKCLKLTLDSKQPHLLFITVNHSFFKIENSIDYRQLGVQL